MHKALFIQIQDRSFASTVIPIPDYLRTRRYRGGVVAQIDLPGEGKPLAQGWVARQWIPSVQQRFQRLIITLAKRFDGKIAGINLPETSLDLDTHKKPTYFTC